MSAARLLVAGLAALAAGCATKPVGEAPGPVTAVTGRISYLVDGRRPAWPAPRFTALRLESGDPYVTPPVAEADGGFRWNLPPGSYVISRIEAGDDGLIAWPRVAFLVPAGSPPVYLGHLALMGTTRAGSASFSPWIADEGVAGPKSLMFHRPDMLAGDPLMEEWRKSRRGVIERIFGASAPRVPE